jgi:hypothetical protein
MSLVIPNFITRKFILSHPMLTFVYGDDLIGNARRGQGEQAFGCANAFAVPTKKRCCESPQGYYRDWEFDLYTKSYIDMAISHIPRFNPIILFPKIGLGRAQLNIQAPKTYDYLMEKLNKLKTTEEIIIDYTLHLNPLYSTI